MKSLTFLPTLTRQKRAWVAVFCCALAGCSIRKDPAAEVYYEGSVLNLVTTQRLDTYSLRIRQNGEDRRAHVSSDGFYRVGPVFADQDFIVTIEAEGFRAFMSAVTHEDVPEANTSRRAPGLSRVFDAWLVPEDAVAGPQTLRFEDADGTSPVRGQVRLMPQSGSALKTNITRPASLTGQEWENTLDLQTGAVFAEISEGVARLQPGQLVYGVTYGLEVISFAVEEGSFLTAAANESFTAGLAPEELTFVVTSTRVLPEFAFLGTNVDEATLVGTGLLEFRFDRPIVITGPASLTALRTLLAGNFTVNSQADRLLPVLDDNGDPVVDPDTGEEEFAFQGNRVADPVTISVRGAQYVGDATTLGFQWNRTLSLEESHPRVAILSVIYGGLNEIFIAPEDGSEEPEALGSIVGALSITVPVQAPITD